MNRLYVEKKQLFNLEALQMEREIKNFLKIDSVEAVRVLYRYDAEGLTQAQFDAVARQIFYNPVTETAFPADYELLGRAVAVEFIPGQYDQRTDFANQIARLVAPEAADKLLIKVSKVFLFSGKISDAELAVIKSYYINHVESLEAKIELPATLKQKFTEPDTVETVKGFSGMDSAALESCGAKLGLGMSLEDLQFSQKYFIGEKKEPTVAELKIFDTFWSDHCRHRTFMTALDNITVEDGRFAPAIKTALEKYYSAKRALSPEKPVCLMDLAVMGMKKAKAEGRLSDMEVSDEVNACSVYAEVVVDGKKEDWLFVFKNETHNHPTEIEPFGGASTCLGGGIRDPLSGRAYVHGAIRLTGCGNPLTPFNKTLNGKLPQRLLTKTAAEGYSSYANQIGLASGHLAEIYDDGFVAKRMECGALVGAVKKEDVVRLSPVEGDVIVLLGGNTGRDGVGGAVGSSKKHDKDSHVNSGAEVQKGNPAIERNIVRLFRDPVASRMIKKCNDFGAGGVSVAVCEIADSLEINLDKVPLKYGGMDGTEIALSESQERMACLLARADLDAFCALADKENLQCVKIADVTADNRVVMRWKGKVIADISSEMLNSGGVRRHATIKVASPSQDALKLTSPEVVPGGKTKENFLNNLCDLNVCSKAGIADRFDTTASAGTVFMPYGGKRQKTAEQGLCMRFPAKRGACSTASLMTFGYNPKISAFSPFHQALYAVLESVNKISAMGGEIDKIRLSFQEYFGSLGNDATRWGKPFAALLGAYLVQDELQIPSIGGKDSMSGTFHDIDVPPSLISFAVSTADVSDVVSAAFKALGSKVIKVFAEIDDKFMPDFDQIRGNIKGVNALIKSGCVLASSTVGFGGVGAAVSNMCRGNALGFEFLGKISDAELYTPDYTAMVLEVKCGADLSALNYKELGTVTADGTISVNGAKITLGEIDAAVESALAEIFPTKYLTKPALKAQKADYYGTAAAASAKIKKARPVAVLPLFPGTNGEYELERGFEQAGAEVKTIIFRNRTAAQQEESVLALAAAIDVADIFAVPSGMSAGCEPVGSAKFIAAVLNRQPVREALTRLIDQRGGLVLGLGEGFSALVRCGLLPHGKFTDENEVFIERNAIDKFICRFVNVRVSSAKSPWHFNLKSGDVFAAPLSVQEGRLVLDEKQFKALSANGQIAAQYVCENGEIAADEASNPCGAFFAVESMTSPDGRIFGKTTSFERVDAGIYKNIPTTDIMPLLKNAVEYFSGRPQVAIIMGSDSDLKIVSPAFETLKKFGIAYEARVLSAHRTPDETAAYIKTLRQKGFKAVIAAAGRAAHLAGAAAANTILPVIGLPIGGQVAAGLDALLATVQMPSGVPVATVAIDGAENAALLALEIIACGDQNLASALEKYRLGLSNAVAAKNQSLQTKISEKK